MIWPEGAYAVKELLGDTHNMAPMIGLGVLAAVGLYFWLRRKPEDAGELERQRRAYLSRVGRIVEGQVLDIVDHRNGNGKSNGHGESNGNGHGKEIFAKNRTAKLNESSQKLLYYTYAISGVTYETAQDITGIEERAQLKRIAAGQVASVKYDPSNPSNSILLADDWSGLH
jgi:hypothetical protein